MGAEAWLLPCAEMYVYTPLEKALEQRVPRPKSTVVNGALTSRARLPVLKQAEYEMNLDRKRSPFPAHFQGVAFAPQDRGGVQGRQQEEVNKVFPCDFYLVSSVSQFAHLGY